MTTKPEDLTRELTDVFKASIGAGAWFRSIAEEYPHDLIVTPEMTLDLFLDLYGPASKLKGTPNENHPS